MEDSVKALRDKFPILKREINGRPLVYLDNAATSQRPVNVMDALRESVLSSNANIHRAVHTLSSEATDAYENARECVRKFINAASRQEIIFTSGTTQSLNTLAYSLSESYLKKGDVVLLSEAEHHSNIVPWHLMAERKGIQVRFIPVDATGHIIMEELLSALKDWNVKVVSVTHISNVLGIVNPVREIVAAAHKAGALVIIDGAQGIVHGNVDVQELDCDFYAFSGHKVYAATGVGVLYGKKHLLEEMPPFMGGGEMVDTVTFKGSAFASLPLKFEAGTSNFNSAVTLVPAIQMALEMRDAKFVDNMKSMISYLDEELRTFQGMHIVGEGEGKMGLFSFALDGVHHEDIAILLDKMGVAVRSGLMCAEPIITKFGYTGLVRVSLAPYNTIEECEYFINSLKKAVKMLR